MKKINKKKQINFQSYKVNKITLLDRGVILFFVLFLVFFIFQTNFVGAADDEEIKEDIEDLQNEKEDLEKKEDKTLTELEKVNQNISATQSVIQKTNQTIEQYEAEIQNKEKVIRTKEETIQFKRSVLAEYLRLFRQNGIEIGLITFDSSRDLGDFLREIESFEDFQNKIRETLTVIEEEKQLIEKEKEEVESKKDEKEEVLETQEQQKQHLVYQENEKKEILQRTRASISEINSKISKLRTELSALLGEGYDTDDIKDAIKYASKKTGVSKGFLFGMLSMESGLGKYTGGCYYKESNMNDTRKAYFKDICEELGYNYKKQKVSCPPKSYNGTGGAMGVAQFMSDTWMGYKDKIANATGHNPPDPWSLVDGVMAMALKLENDGATEDGDVRITSPCTGKKVYVDWEDYAAMKYLGWSCYALTNYAPAIQNLKDGYDNL